MDIISSLESGFEGAENGSAIIYQRGTTTPAVYFSDFEGLSSVTAGTTVTLDSNGAAQVYVNQLVTVVVSSSAGVTLETFVPGKAAPGIEVRSLSFNGPDYVTGASAAGNPTTLQAILDLIVGSFGTEDFKVDVDGTATDLSTAIANSTGVFYNVKSPTYGAVGDGTTNDTTAIQAAIDAANTAGGGIVFFPEGTYKTTAVLTLPPTVSLLGAGPQVTQIRVADGTANCINTTSAPGTITGAQTIQGLRLGASETNTGAAIDFAVAMDCQVINCFLGDATFSTATTGLVGCSAACRITYKNCKFVVAANNPIHRDTAATFSIFEDCEFVSFAGSQNSSLSRAFGEVKYSRCTFDASASVSGTYTMVDLLTNLVSKVTIEGCTFLGGVGTVTGVGTPTLGTAASTMQEANNIFDVGVDTSFALNTDFTGAVVDTRNTFSSREGMTDIQGSTGAVTVDAEGFGNTVVVATSSATQTFTFPANGVPGMKHTLTMQNSTGAGVTLVAFVTVSGDQDTIPTIADGNFFVATFVYAHFTSGGNNWMLSGKNV